jgi:uncharacterized surface protein with fasciclin (FAS1) repeats
MSISYRSVRGIVRAGVAAGALCAALVLAACGATDQAAEQTNTTQTAEPENSPATVVDGPGVLDAIRDSGQFTTALELIEVSGVLNDLPGSGPWTFLLPTDEAFAALGDEEVAALRSDPERLRSVLLEHVLEGVYTAETFPSLVGFTVSSVTGQPLSVAEANGALVLVGVGEGDEQIIVTPLSITGSNGVVHGIDRVIIRPN